MPKGFVICVDPKPLKCLTFMLSTQSVWWSLQRHAKITTKATMKVILHFQRLFDILRQIKAAWYDGKIGGAALVFDTNSIIFSQRPEPWELPIGNILGDWDNQLENSEFRIARFLSCSPKVYSHETNTERIEMEVEEMTQNWFTEGLLDYVTNASTVLEGSWTLLIEAFIGWDWCWKSTYLSRILGKEWQDPANRYCTFRQDFKYLLSGFMFYILCVVPVFGSCVQFHAIHEVFIHE